MSETSADLIQSILAPFLADGTVTVYPLTWDRKPTLLRGKSNIRRVRYDNPDEKEHVAVLTNEYDLGTCLADELSDTGHTEAGIQSGVDIDSSTLKATVHIPFLDLNGRPDFGDIRRAKEESDLRGFKWHVFESGRAYHVVVQALVGEDELKSFHRHARWQPDLPDLEWLDISCTRDGGGVLRLTSGMEDRPAPFLVATL